MDLALYRAFSEEIKTSAGTSLFGAVKEKIKEKAKDVGAAASESAGHKGRELGSAIGEGIAQHAPAVGSHLGAGIAQHAGPVGEGIGKGMAQHFGHAGGELIHGARRAAEDIAKSPKVRAGAAIGALAYGGLKAHQLHRQNKRDKDQRRIADALETLSKKGR